MHSRQMSAHHITLAVLFIFLALGHSARADTIKLAAIFVKCDGLMGKSPKAVLAVLGPPTETSESPKDSGIYYTLIWHYEDPGPSFNAIMAPVHSVTLTFDSKRTLVGVTYNGFAGNNPIFTDAPASNPSGRTYPPQAVVADICKVCTPSALKIGYDERTAADFPSGSSPTETWGYPVVLKGRTRANNFFYFTANVNAPNPVTVTRHFDADANVYKNVTAPNPDFKIIFSKLYDFNPGVMTLVLWGAQARAQGKEPFGGENYGASFMHYQPVTDQIMPWMYNGSPLTAQ